MAGYRPCKCVYCGKPLDRNLEEWEQAPSNRYAHKSCYDKRQEEIQEQKTEREYKAKIHEKVQEVCGIQYVKSRVDKQLKEFIDKGMTTEKLYKALEYWYDVKKSDPAAAHGGIGILPYIYEESDKYWARRAAIKDNNSNVNKESLETSLIVQQALPRQCNHKEKIIKPKRKTFFMLD